MQMEVHRVATPRISPSGEWVVFAVSRADLVADRWVNHLHRSRIDGSESSDAVPLAGFRDPQWGPNDATLFALAADDAGRDRVFRIDLNTGQSQPVTPAEHPVGWYETTADGSQIAYTTLDTLPAGGSRWRLRAVTLANGRTQTWELPGDVASFSWSPAGDRLVASCQPSTSLDWRQKFLVLLDRERGEIKKLATGPGAAWLPRFGPEGRRVAFVASRGPATWMRDAELRVLDVASGDLTTLAATPDHNVDLVAWHPDGEALLGYEYQGSTHRLLRVPVDGGAPVYIGAADRSVFGVDVRGSRIVFASERWNEPAEVFTADLAGEGIDPVSAVQEPPPAPLGHTTMVRWRADDGTAVEGILTLPVGYRRDERVPLLVRLHGGPPFPAADSYLGGSYRTAYPLASMASAGFAILQPNFRGSAGYGRAFRHGLHDEWGGQDFRDVVAGVEALVDQGIADPRRVGVMGWSYGGNLTARSITQHSPFVAASMGAAMTDLLAFDEQTNLGGMMADWFSGPDEARRAAYRERSPLTHAEGVRGPVLVQHGRNDQRVPFDQADRFVKALRDRGLEVDFRAFDFGHGPRSPRDELAVLQQNLDWFVRTVRDRDGPE